MTAFLYTGSGVSVSLFKCWSYKNETMSFNSDRTTGFLGEMSFFNYFGKSVFLILHYQSGRFPGKMNWTGEQLVLASLSSVLDVWNQSQNLSTDRHKFFSWNVEVHSKISQPGCDRFCLEICLNAVRLLRYSSIHLAWKSTTIEKR